jgi:hypothetical protein
MRTNETCGNTIDKKPESLRSLGAIAAHFALAGLFFFVGPGFAAQQKSNSYKLSDLKILTQEGIEEVSVKLVLNGNQIYARDFATIQGAPEPEVRDNIPSRSCQSDLLYFFSGGGHCCTTLLLCTACGVNYSAVEIDLADSDDVGFVDSDSNGVSEIRVRDPSFAYSTVSDSVNLEFVYSPAPARLLVFEDQRWRPDRPGEFRSFYEKALIGLAKTPLKGPQPKEIAARAITEAYDAICRSNREG